MCRCIDCPPYVRHFPVLAVRYCLTFSAPPCLSPSDSCCDSSIGTEHKISRRKFLGNRRWRRRSFLPKTRSTADDKRHSDYYLRQHVAAFQRPLPCMRLTNKIRLGAGWSWTNWPGRRRSTQVTGWRHLRLRQLGCQSLKPTTIPLPMTGSEDRRNQSRRTSSRRWWDDFDSAWICHDTKAHLLYTYSIAAVVIGSLRNSQRLGQSQNVEVFHLEIAGKNYSLVPKSIEISSKFVLEYSIWAVIITWIN